MGKGKQCHNEAAWVVWFAAGGMGILLCNEHHQQALIAGTVHEVRRLSPSYAGMTAPQCECREVEAAMTGADRRQCRNAAVWRVNWVRRHGAVRPRAYCDTHWRLIARTAGARGAMVELLLPAQTAVQCEWLDVADVTPEMPAAEPEPVLCYVDRPWAYFTTQALAEQWGDDWNDAPYQHNAGRPYEAYGDKAGAWRIVRVAFEAGCEMECPADRSARYSVEEINGRLAPWLSPVSVKHRMHIWAGTPLSEFVRLIRETGGQVYTEATGGE